MFVSQLYIARNPVPTRPLQPGLSYQLRSRLVRALPRSQAERQKLGRRLDGPAQSAARDATTPWESPATHVCGGRRGGDDAGVTSLLPDWYRAPLSCHSREVKMGELASLKWFSAAASECLTGWGLSGGLFCCRVIDSNEVGAFRKDFCKSSRLVRS